MAQRTNLVVVEALQKQKWIVRLNKKWRITSRVASSIFAREGGKGHCAVRFLNSAWRKQRTALRLLWNDGNEWNPLVEKGWWICIQPRFNNQSQSQLLRVTRPLKTTTTSRIPTTFGVPYHSVFYLSLLSYNGALKCRGLSPLSWKPDGLKFVSEIPM